MFHLTITNHEDKTRTWNQRLRLRFRVGAEVRDRVSIRVEVRVLV